MLVTRIETRPAETPGRHRGGDAVEDGDDDPLLEDGSEEPEGDGADALDERRVDARGSDGSSPMMNAPGRGCHPSASVSAAAARVWTRTREMGPGG
ncbi:MAG: hypothetical protein DLM54_01120 [Acidimicrobiales bacterium]|nr:MAG: hypothetical protein DLM54_01120 [Acidimicrobiales bacterium]